MDVNADEQREADEARQRLLIADGMREDYVRDIKALAEGNTFKFGAETIGDFAPRFVKAVKTAVRVSFWTGLTGVTVWVLRNQHSLPPAYDAALPGVVIAIIFNVTQNLASTVQSCIQALVGTLFAIAASGLLYLVGTHPKADSPEGPPTCPGPGESTADATDTLFNWYCVSSADLVTADSLSPGGPTLLAFVFFALFVAVTLALNVVMPFKTFALVTAVTMMMNFANPSAETSNYMSFTWDSCMVVTLVTQLIGSAIAICAMLLPPVTASKSALSLAAQATQVTAELLISITDYYCGSEKTLKINVYNSQIERNRETLSAESGDLDNAWWEYFDWGRQGIVRNLMLDHLSMLRDVDRRLAVMQVCVLREGFEAGHKRVMATMRQPMIKLVHDIGNCLLNCTICAADGHFSEDETKQVNEWRDKIEGSVTTLTDTWRTARGGLTETLSEGMRAESLFLLELCTVARLVREFAGKVTDKDRASTVKYVALSRMMEIVSINKLKDPDFRNFILRNWISLMLAWWWANMSNGFATTLPVNVVFMLTELPGNSMLMNLEKLEASVLGSLAGTVLYRAFHYCWPVVKFLKNASLFFFTLVSMFVANYTKEYANVGLLLAVYGGGKLMKPCDAITTNGEVLMLNRDEFKSLRLFAYAMCIVSVVDSVLKPQAAADQGRQKLCEAMDLTFDYLTKLLDDELGSGREKIWSDTTAKTEEVEGLLKAAQSLSGPAEQEPRFAKGPFKTALFEQLCEKALKIQLNVQVLARRCQGAEVGLIAGFTRCPSWPALKKDMQQTIDFTKRVATGVINYDGFGAMDPTGFGDVLDQPGLSKLEALKDIEREVKTNAAFSHVESPDLEEGVYSRIAGVFMILELLVEELSDTISISVRSM